MSNIINFQKKEKPPHVCSFCKTPKSKAKYMMEGDNESFICISCVDRCKELIEESDKIGEPNETIV